MDTLLHQVLGMVLSSGHRINQRAFHGERWNGGVVSCVVSRLSLQQTEREEKEKAGGHTWYAAGLFALG